MKGDSRDSCDQSDALLMPYLQEAPSSSVGDLEDFRSWLSSSQVVNYVRPPPREQPGLSAALLVYACKRPLLSQHQNRATTRVKSRAQSPIRFAQVRICETHTTDDPNMIQGSISAHFFIDCLTRALTCIRFQSKGYTNSALRR